MFFEDDSYYSFREIADGLGLNYSMIRRHFKDESDGLLHLGRHINDVIRVKGSKVKSKLEELRKKKKK